MRCYREYYANVHRGVHYLSQRGHRGLRGRARARCSASSNAASDREIVFVRGTTEGINLVAPTLRRASTSARATRC